MSKSPRVFNREFKLGIVRRILAGEDVSALGRELKLSRQDLYAWRDRFLSGGPRALRGRGRPPRADSGAVAPATTKAPPDGPGEELAAARRRVAELERKRPAAGRTRFFSASLAAGQRTTPAEHRAWREGVYAVIQAMTAPLPQGTLAVERMCALAGVSRAGYYRHWAASAPRQEETAARDAVQRAALAHVHYGYRRIAAEPRRAGFAVNHKRVLRPMRQDNLLRLKQRPFVPVTTQSRHGWRVVPNLARGMELTGLDQLRVADITYIRLLEEFAYLAVVLDAFSRRVVGWALETHLEARLAIAALAMALEARRPAPDSLIDHSDRGVQYACGDYTEILAAHGIQASMSRIGNP